jgi:hypothetical protein
MDRLSGLCLLENASVSLLRTQLVSASEKAHRQPV